MKYIVWCCVLFIERCFLNVQIIKQDRRQEERGGEGRGVEKGKRGIEGKNKKTVICGLILVKCLNFC